MPAARWVLVVPVVLVVLGFGRQVGEVTEDHQQSCGSDAL
jgi:hypothetical protein